jgi:hypothetical protein
VFRWTPLASDLGEHALDFTVSDGAHEVVVTITITVVVSVTSPTRAPLGSGTTLDPMPASAWTRHRGRGPDTAQVTITQAELAIAGATSIRSTARPVRGGGVRLPSNARSVATRSCSPRTTARISRRSRTTRAAVERQCPTCTDDASEDDDSSGRRGSTTFPSSSTGTSRTADDDRYAVPLFTGEKMIVNLTPRSRTRKRTDCTGTRARSTTPCDADDPLPCSIANGQSADSNEHTEPRSDRCAP